eukprot:1688395-Alexandrium_andersonii.AAC.1
MGVCRKPLQTFQTGGSVAPHVRGNPPWRGSTGDCPKQLEVSATCVQRCCARGALAVRTQCRCKVICNPG